VWVSGAEAGETGELLFVEFGHWQFHTPLSSSWGCSQSGGIGGIGRVGGQSAGIRASLGRLLGEAAAVVAGAVGSGLGGADRGGAGRAGAATVVFGVAAGVEGAWGGAAGWVAGDRRDTVVTGAGGGGAGGSAVTGIGGAGAAAAIVVLVVGDRTTMTSSSISTRSMPATRGESPANEPPPSAVVTTRADPTVAIAATEQAIATRRSIASRFPCCVASSCPQASCPTIARSPPNDGTNRHQFVTYTS